MAEGGQAEFSNTVGSGFVFDFYCELCKDDDINVEANGFCVDCEEYLCNICINAHKKSRPTRLHDLLDQTSMPKDNPLPQDRVNRDISTKCKFHSSKLVEFYCTTHYTLGCSTCFATVHKHCENVESVFDKSKNVLNSEEYGDFSRHLAVMEENAHDMILKTRDNVVESEQFSSHAIDLIRNHRKDVRLSFDELELNLITHVATNTSEDKQRMKDLENKLAELSKAIEQLRSEEKNLVKSRRDCQLYVQMKFWKDDISVIEEKLDEARESNDIRLFSFEPNNELNNASNGSGLGRIQILNRQNKEIGIDGNHTTKDITKAYNPGNLRHGADSTSVDEHAEEVIHRTDIKNDDVDGPVAYEISSFQDTIEKSKGDESSNMKLKYKYSKGRWTPVNAEGKKQYSREFLLQFQFDPTATCIPKGLPDIPDIILDKPLIVGRTFAKEQVQGDNGGNGDSFEFTTHYVWTSRQSKDLSREKKNNNSHDDSQPKQTHLSISEDIKLPRAEDDCTPTSKEATKNENENPQDLPSQQTHPRKVGHTVTKELAEGSGCDDSDGSEITPKYVMPTLEQDGFLSLQDLLKKTRRILNKLTPHNFQTLASQMQSLPFDSKNKFNGVIKLIIEKAISGPHSSFACANMCRCLSTFGLDLHSENQSTVTMNFRAALQAWCEKEFGKENSTQIILNEKREIIEATEPGAMRDELKAELDFEESKSRRSSFGKIRFISDLFKQKILSETTMHGCVYRLLWMQYPEYIECLCQLLITIGKELDVDNAKLQMDQHFQQMMTIINDKKLSSRVRFLLQNVEDLRMNRWIPHQEVNSYNQTDIARNKAIEDAADSGTEHGDVCLKSKHVYIISKVDKHHALLAEKEEKGKTNVNAKYKLESHTSKKKKKYDRDFLLQFQFDSAAAFKPQGMPDIPEINFDNSKQDMYVLQTKTILSKLTPKTVETVVSQIQALPVDSEAKLCVVIHQIVKKAISEPNISRACASVGFCLSWLEVPACNKKTENVSFHDYLLTRCEREFEKFVHMKPLKRHARIKDTAIEAEHGLAIENQRFLGIIRLIGELFNLKMLSEEVMHTCVNELLQKRDNEKLESLCLLLTIIGSEMDHDKTKPKMDKHFGQLQKLTDEQTRPLTLRSNLQAVIDLRLNKWIPEKEDTNSNLVDIADEKGVLTEPTRRAKRKQRVRRRKQKGTVADIAGENNVNETLPDETMWEILEKMRILIMTENVENDAVFDWINTHVDEPIRKHQQFTRVLMTVICYSAIKGNENDQRAVSETVVKRKDLLMKYITNRTDHELYALYALQATVTGLNHPPGVVRSLFGVLHSNSVISEDVFWRWKRSEDEPDGKMECLNELGYFYFYEIEA